MDEAKSPSREVEPQKSRPTLWISSTYFAEGFPYAIINSLAEILFRDIGASLAGVGLTSLFHLPWNLKFVWAPLMERTLTMRKWVVVLEIVLALLFAAGGALLLLYNVGISKELLLILFSALFLAAAFASASHDVAVDAHYLEAQGAADQARYVGLRSGAYKIASILVRGPSLALIAAVGWSLGLGVFALVLGALALLHARTLRTGASLSSPRSPRAPSSPLASLSGSLVRRRVISAMLVVFGATFILSFALTEVSAVRDFMSGVSSGGALGWLLIAGLVFAIVLSRRRASGLKPPAAFARLLGLPRFPLVLSFIVLFRLGESFLQKMKWPFLSEAIGLTKGEYGTLNGTVGVLLSFAGLVIGGRLIAKSGLERWFWPCVLAQNVLNLLYVGLALVPSVMFSHELDLWIVGSVIVIEEFGAGLGASVLMVFLMRLCHGEHRASEYALLTAVMTLGFTIAGALSGFVAEWFGYAGFFFASFLLSLPMMLLAPEALARSRQFGVSALDPVRE